MRNIIKKYWAYISNLGLEQESGIEEGEQQRIRMLNQLAVILGLSCAVSLPIYIYNGNVPYITLCLVTILGLLIPLIFNVLMSYRVAQISFICVTQLLLLGIAFIFGERVQIEYSLLLIPLIAPIFFKQKRVRFGISMMAVVLFGVYKFIYYSFAPVVELGEEKHVMGFLLGGSLITIFYFVSEIFGGEVEAQLHKIQTQNKTLARQKEDLEASENRLQQIFDIMAEGVLYVNSDDEIQFVTDRFCEFIGYTKEELIGQPAQQMLMANIKEDVAVFEEQLRLRKEGQTSHYEVRMKRKDGAVVWALISGSPLYNKQGTQIGSVGIHLDITDRKRIEQQLQAEVAEHLKTSKYLQSIVSNMPVILFVLDNQGTFILADGNGLKNVGLDGRVLIGRDAMEVYGQFEHLRPYVEMALKGERFSYTTWMGEYFFSTSHVPVFDEAQNFLYTIGISTEITEIKRTEERLKASVNELQHFAYITSHNLREPVANIVGMLQLYDKELKDQEMNQVVIDSLEKSAANLDRMVKDLHQIISVKKVIGEERIKIDLEEVVEKIVQSIQHKIDEVEAVIQTNFEEAPWLITNRTYLDSILLNLIGNAIKYRVAKRKPLIRLSSSRNNNRVYIKVMDNGMGIDLQKNGNKLFGLYNRFHHHVKGTGLGLYLTKMQIEAMGGKIEVASEVNVGTTFVIELLG